ncbi:hypothetical protein C8R45DRAFT_1034731 [Mycena sanguinolenta]|nr:hypothetical protein C8R45DRAFT_1034731 [Mycena sanguinolenta]
MDPASQMLEKLRAGSLSGHSSPAPDDQDMDDNLSDSEELPRHLTSGTSLTPVAPSLVVFGNLVKNQVKLSGKSTVAFDQFVRLRSPDERNVVLFAHVLELLDATRRNEKAEQYEISSDLSTKVRDYTRAFYYSPQLSAYRCPKATEHILTAMRECKISKLPPDADTSSTQLVLSTIGDRATHYRNVMKKAVASSLQPGSPLKNIAELANKVIQGSSVKATPQLSERSGECFRSDHWKHV